MANIVDIIIKGKDQSKKALTAPIKNLKDLKTAAKQLGPAFKLGVTAAVGALGALTFSAIKTAEETQKMAQMLGISTEGLSTLSFASRIAGTDVDVLKKAMQRMSVQVLDAGRGLKEAKDNFADLGLNVRDAGGNLKSSEVLFKEAADAISVLPDGLNKTALAMKVFGKSGAQLIPLLNEGADGINKLQKQAKDLGLEIDNNTAEASAHFIDNLEISKSAVTGFGNSLAKELLPSLNVVTDGMNEASEKGQGLKGMLDGLTVILGFLGKTIFSIFEGLKFLFDVTSGLIASLSAKIFAAVTGNSDLIKGIDAEFKQQLVDSTEGTANRINEIWADHNQKRVDNNKEKNDKLLEDERIAKEERLKLLQEEADKKAALEKSIRAKLAAGAKARGEAEKKQQAKIDTAKKNSVKNTTGAIFSFAKTAAGDNAKTQQRIALGEAIVNGALAVSKANASAPPPFNIPAIAFAVAQGVAQIATIKSATFADGGIVPGPQGQTGDRVLAGLNPGEVILNAAQQENLVGQIGRTGEGTTHFTATISERVLFDIITEGTRSGQLAIDKGALV